MIRHSAGCSAGRLLAPWRKVRNEPLRQAEEEKEKEVEASGLGLNCQVTEHPQHFQGLMSALSAFSASECPATESLIHLTEDIWEFDPQKGIEQAQRWILRGRDEWMLRPSAKSWLYLTQASQASSDA